MIRQPLYQKIDALSDDELYLLVSDSELSIDHVLPARRTYALCLAAVRINGWALRYVPDMHLSQEMCIKAVQQDSASLFWVPPEHTEICIALLRIGEK